jgi:3-phenylpropionate/trans-cinnamate dioxygenase ferredoxin subunit
MDDWLDAGEEVALPCGRGRFVWTDDGGIALFRTADGVFAIADSCPHAGASLAGGRLEGRHVSCRAHGLAFDVVSGCARGVPNLRVARHEVRIEAGRVRVRRQPD